MSQASITKCGYVAIIGKPNVGKSTLLNKLIGQKISITSRKPQTTRHKILGIHTQDDTQIVYVDTPGVHNKQKLAINRYMNKAVSSAIFDVDVIVLVVDAFSWNELDEMALQKIKQANRPVILVINKIDKIKDKDLLLPQLQRLAELYSFHAMIPVSAKNGNGIAELEKEITQLLPAGPFLFDAEQVTDRPMKFLAAEMIREKIFRLCGQELPYSVTVDIEKFKLENNIYHIAALILVEKENHKIIIIGNKGAKLKEIGTQARLDIEKALQHKVFLQLWLKVKSGWSDDSRALNNLGYDEL